MWREFGEDVQFFVVYIREAHALDSSWPMGGGDNPILLDPRDLIERREVATVCMAKLDLEPIPALVDDIGDEVATDYGASPDRLYLVGTDGTIVYKGGPGPFGFHPDELDEAIRAELGVE